MNNFEKVVMYGNSGSTKERIVEPTLKELKAYEGVYALKKGKCEKELKFLVYDDQRKKPYKEDVYTDPYTLNQGWVKKGTFIGYYRVKDEFDGKKFRQRWKGGLILNRDHNRDIKIDFSNWPDINVKGYKGGGMCEYTRTPYSVFNKNESGR